MQDINNILPEEVLCAIFEHVSPYMLIARGVCKRWNRIYLDFTGKEFLLLAYIYKDNVVWLKEEYFLPENIGALYKRPGFSASGMEKLVSSVVEEGNPDTLIWMLNNKDIACDKRELFRKAVEKKNYKVLNWMKKQGLIDSTRRFADLLQTVLPKAQVYSCARVYLKKGDKNVLRWYLASGLPYDAHDLDLVFARNKEEKESYLMQD